jgi:hypothetical protein
MTNHNNFLCTDRIFLFLIMLLFVFLALQLTVVVFSQPGSGLWPPRVRRATVGRTPLDE